MASSFTRNSGWVWLTSRSIMLTTAPATKAPRMVSSPVFSATTTSDDEQQHGAPDPDLGGGVLQADQHLRDLHAPAETGHRQPTTSTSRSDEDAEQDELRPDARGVAGEQQRQQQHGGEVAERRADDHELTEGGRAEARPPSARGSPGRATWRPASRRRAAGWGSARRRRARSPASRPSTTDAPRPTSAPRAAGGRGAGRARSPSPDRNSRKARPTRARICTGSSALGPTEHGRPDDDAEHDLDDDAWHPEARHETENEPGEERHRQHDGQAGERHVGHDDLRKRS